MAKTVNEAFRIFMTEIVNLDKEQTGIARRSRDWMISQIHQFEGNYKFPDLCNGIDMSFGSFARRTKIRELDDIDLMIGFSANGSSWSVGDNGIEIRISDTAVNLKRLCHPYSNCLNSRLVINQITGNLNRIPQYESADIKRNHEATTLNLKSYPWNFDIVPCFITREDEDGQQFYLIPDGKGNWKPTDPRIDQSRISRINQYHNGIVLPTIRLMKYWQRRGTMPSMSSYLLECILLEFYELRQNSTSYIDEEFIEFTEYLQDRILYEVTDPKGLQGNINLLNSYEVQRISQRAKHDFERSSLAREYEHRKNFPSAIELWNDILGDQFPRYC